MNITEKNTKQIPSNNNEITFQNIANPQIMLSPQTQPQDKQIGCKLTKRTRIVIGLSTFLTVILVVGLSLGLTIGSTTQFNQTGITTIAEWDDGHTLVYSEYQMQKKKFFINQPLVTDDSTGTNNPLPYKIIIAKEKKQINKIKRSLQEETDPTDSYTTYINFDQMGLSFAVSPDNNIQVRVQTDAFSDYVYRQFSENQRLLMFTPDPFELAHFQDIKEQLQNILNLEFDTQQAVQLQQTTIVQYALDPVTSKFEPKPKTQTESRLLTQRLLTQKQQKRNVNLWPQINRLMPEMIKPKIEKIIINVLKEVKENGKEIATAAGRLGGALVGGVTGVQSGPLGIIEGAVAGEKTGMIIGQAIGKNAQKIASAELLACVPHDSVTIKCSTETLKQNIEEKLDGINEDIEQNAPNETNRLKNGLIGFITEKLNK